MTVSTPGSRSRAWATRPPQKVDSPVTRTRRPMSSPPPDAAPVAQHVVQGLLQPDTDGLSLLHDAAARVPLLARLDVDVHRFEHTELELGRQVQHGPEQ